MLRKCFYLGLAIFGIILSVLPAFAADEDPPTTGELIINEIMINPAPSGVDTAGEWIELVNISGESRELNGCSISDGATEGTFTWETSTIVQASDYHLLCRDDQASNAPNGCDTVYGSDAGSLQLSNSGDDLTLSCGSTTIDAVSWGSSFATTGGRSQEFNTKGGDPAQENDTTTDKCDPTNGYWCDTPAEPEYNYISNEYGTPGARNTDWTGPTAVRLDAFTVSFESASSTPASFFVVLGVSVLCIAGMVVSRGWLTAP